MNKNDFIGIDVAKDKFDVCFLKEDGSRLEQQFVNTLSGFKAFLAWVKKIVKHPG